ncbi:hypothetical protein [Streptomyces chartreusis]|uniref:hypothetical protein n=1 Tax=Streptomyces chartreusis TaxID=1969 RepID=UPI002F90EA9F|nr:hypothetical protein OG938_44290 [Streptomyces chartreusis]
MIHYSVEGSIDFRPSVPLAQLWELTEDGPFVVAPPSASERELRACVERHAWVLIPDPVAGTDEQGRAMRIRGLRVDEPEMYCAGVLNRLERLSAFIGHGHELIGSLRYEGDDVPGDVGSVEPVAGGGCPLWRPTRNSTP